MGIFHCYGSLPECNCICKVRDFKRVKLQFHNWHQRFKIQIWSASTNAKNICWLRNKPGLLHVPLEHQTQHVNESIILSPKQGMYYSNPTKIVIFTANPDWGIQASISRNWCEWETMMFSLIHGHHSKTETKPCRNTSVKLQGGPGGVQVQGRSFNLRIWYQMWKIYKSHRVHGTHGTLTY